MRNAIAAGPRSCDASRLLRANVMRPRERVIRRRGGGGVNSLTVTALGGSAGPLSVSATGHMATQKVVGSP
jgi:hypothetical protein